MHHMLTKWTSFNIIYCKIIHGENKKLDTLYLWSCACVCRGLLLLSMSTPASCSHGDCHL